VPGWRGGSVVIGCADWRCMYGGLRKRQRAEGRQAGLMQTVLHACLAMRALTYICMSKLLKGRGTCGRLHTYNQAMH
jgi:hypothetical protein